LLIGGVSGRLGFEKDIRTYPEGMKRLSQGVLTPDIDKTARPAEADRVILWAPNEIQERFVKRCIRKF
jgi:hypothetical protein